MPWMMFLLALLSFVLLCYAKSVVFGFVCVVLTLGFIGYGMLKLLSSQLDNTSRDGGRIITSEELRLYREQAEARKQAAASNTAAQATEAPADPSQPPPAASP